MNRPIRILFTIPNFKTAGSQQVLLGIANRLNSDDFEVFIGVESYLDAAKSVVDESYLVQLPHPFKVSKQQYLKEYIKIIKTKHIDIVHSWDYKSIYLEPLACRMGRVKYVYTKKNNSWSRAWYLKSVLSHFIVYDNPEMKSRFFKKRYFNKKIKLIPHGIDLSVFRPLDKVVSSKFNLCCVGNINPNKNQLFLINALLQLPDQVHLNLYGKHDTEYMLVLNDFVYRNRLEDRVHFKGLIENRMLPDVFKHQDVFVLTSKEEGLPVSILEAMACGVPVLCSDSGGGTRFILKGDLVDHIVSLENHNEFVRGIERLMDDRAYYEKVRSLGLQIVREKFTIDTEVALNVAVYFKLMGRNEAI